MWTAHTHTLSLTHTYTVLFLKHTRASGRTLCTLGRPAPTHIPRPTPTPTYAPLQRDRLQQYRGKMQAQAASAQSRAHGNGTGDSKSWERIPVMLKAHPRQPMLRAATFHLLGSRRSAMHSPRPPLDIRHRQASLRHPPHPLHHGKAPRVPPLPRERLERQEPAERVPRPAAQCSRRAPPQLVGPYIPLLRTAARRAAGCPPCECRTTPGSGCRHRAPAET